VEEPLPAPRPQHLLTPQQKSSIFFTPCFAKPTQLGEEAVEEDLGAVEVEEAVEEVEDLLWELLPCL
jgi:hypothetical protein